MLPVARRRPDGVELRWRLTLRPEPFGDGLVPFLIDWADSPHPALQGPQEARLRDFRGEHPEPEAVQSALSALGVDLELRAAASARLLARIEGPAGEFLLS